MVLGEFSVVIYIPSNLTQGRYEQLITQKQDKNCKRLHITICFQLWKERCNRIFRGTQATEEQIRDEIKLQYAQGRIQGGWVGPLLIFQKRLKNMYNFVKKLKIYISDPL
jgi:hypothetical protein